MAEATIGVIGGSGLYEMEGFTDVEEHDLSTPFGKPSDPIVIGTLQGKRLAFLPRHGHGHRILPGEVNMRANIYALKSVGVERIIAVNACGSMKEEIAPSHIVIPDQIIDRTKGRMSTFFGNGLAVHVSFAEPFCPQLSDILYEAAKKTGATVHKGGTYVCIEGPRFSTKAESRMHRDWDVDIIGMTAIPEAVLAREAEICYATIAGVTDYDCWQEACAPLAIDAILDNQRQQIQKMREIIGLAVSRIPDNRERECATALKTAIVTDPKLISHEQKAKLKLLIGNYLK